MAECLTDFKTINGLKYNSKHFQVNEYIFKPVCKKKQSNGSICQYCDCVVETCRSKFSFIIGQVRGKIYGKVHNHSPNIFEELRRMMLADIKQEIRSSNKSIKECFDIVSIKKW